MKIKREEIEKLIEEHKLTRCFEGVRPVYVFEISSRPCVNWLSGGVMTSMVPGASAAGVISCRLLPRRN